MTMSISAPSRHSGWRRIILINIVVFADPDRRRRLGAVQPRRAWSTNGSPASRNKPASSPTRWRNTPPISDTRSLKVDDAAPLLRDLLAPTRLARAALRHRRPARDRYAQSAGAQHRADRRSCRRSTTGAASSWRVSRFYDGMMGVRPFAKLEPYFEAGKDGRVYQRGRRARCRATPPRPSASTSRTSSCSPWPCRCSASRRSTACCSFPPKAATSTTSCARSAPR